MLFAHLFTSSLLLIALSIAAPMQRSGTPSPSREDEDNVNFGALYEYLDKIQSQKAAPQTEANILPEMLPSTRESVARMLPPMDHQSLHQQAEVADAHHQTSSTKRPGEYVPVPKKKRRRNAYITGSPQSQRDNKMQDQNNQRVPLILRDGRPAIGNIPPNAVYQDWNRLLAIDDRSRLFREFRKHLPLARRTLSDRLQKACDFKMACDVLMGDSKQQAAAIKRLGPLPNYREPKLKETYLGSRTAEIADKVQKMTKLSWRYTEHMINRVNQKTAQKLLSDQHFEEGVKNLRKEVPWVKKTPKYLLEDKQHQSINSPLKIRRKVGRPSNLSRSVDNVVKMYGPWHGNL